MSLGKKIRQARLEAGLSQRALCGDAITRNMLSQIENGSANPSMQTLQYLAGRLEKPIGFFLEEGSPEVPVHPLVQAVTALQEARHQLAAGKNPSEALRQAQIPAAPDWLLRQAILLQAQLQTDPPQDLVSLLPSLDPELLLRARAALDLQQPQRAVQLLAAAQDRDDPQWQLLMGTALCRLQSYADAAAHLHRAEAAFPHQTSGLLEQCYRELEDYQKAYFYACRVRSLSIK